MTHHLNGLRRICCYKYMSVYQNRLIRSMYKDVYLPIVCYASRTSFYSQLGYCKCMMQCKFMGKEARELRQNRYYPHFPPGKDPQ
ncbi:hypothetical protein MPVG_00011 [Micromonas pusilla virus 12T]|uniref:hypothetical protein n=1 Tax=Micromonas pusilla virus 12T TaxID=755272 RepID=UPI0002C061F4|nr:hypothetical protein MPVG_00011 [Micromonas pusilla virus 12T]AGH30835.1 hypothetical protein MPVG_00011 [Micromonas pusilla virus 12T]